MRVKTFTADSTAAAMTLVRDTLGDDAVIVSSYSADDGVACVIAATEPAEPANEDIKAAEEPAPDVDEDLLGFLRQAMVSHGVPARLADRLAKIAAEAERPTAVSALAHAFETQLGFAPLEAFEDGMQPLMLVGPPGAGKTVTVAKICARAHVAKMPVHVVTTDLKRAGGVEQLAAFTRILELELHSAPDPEALIEIMRSLRDQPGRVVIDTAGSNPYDDQEMGLLTRLMDAADAEVVLTLAAGSDAEETADMACLYADIGASRIIATRMDIARRFGGVITAADAARLPLADISMSHRVIDGLAAITPAVLARLFMPNPDGHPISTTIAEPNEEQL